MPTPNEGETQDEFIERCIPIVLEDDTAEHPPQAAAICAEMWEDAQKEQEQDKARGREMERKIFVVPSATMKADGDQGIVETVFAVFGNVDQGGDIIHPGAFSKTFAERGQKVKVLDAHGATGSVRDAIGKPLELRELARDELPQKILQEYPTATGGALARLQFLMDTPEGDGAFKRIKDGVVDEWSFGYDALDSDMSRVFQDGEEATVRNLRTLKLYEISPVLWGMNPATATTGVKGAEDTSEANEDNEEEKAGRVLAQRNADRITSALQTIIDVLEDAGLDVPGWTRQPQSQPPEDEAKTFGPNIPGIVANDHKMRNNDAPATEQAASDKGEPQEAGPQIAPTLLERERLKLLIEIEEAM